MNILIPMAGAGSRFKKEGYKTSKPLILVNQKPMVVEATSHLPKGEKYIYICRVNNIANDHIDKEIKKYYSDAQFIVINELTEGQAATCLLAKDEINNICFLLNKISWHLNFKFYDLIILIKRIININI